MLIKELAHSVVPLRSRPRSLERSGQALMELAVGMLALVMVVSALCGFGVFIARSLRAQNSTRSGSTDGNGEVEVGIQIGNHTLEKMRVKEHCQMPQMTIVK